MPVKLADTPKDTPRRRALLEKGQNPRRVTSRIGVAVFPEDGDRESVLMRKADQAMYAAKREATNLFRVRT
jgi:GGDEF domain-containing protein